MKTSALLRSIILIPLFPFFLSCASSDAMDDSKKNEGASSKQQRYFYPQNLEKEYTITGTTNNANSGGDEPSTNSANSAEDNSLDEVKTEEKIYKKEKKIKRSKSVSNLFKKGLPRTFSKKTKDTGKGTDTDENNTDTDEKDLDSKNKISFANPINVPVTQPNNSVPEVPEVQKIAKIQRQRSWGKNPHIIVQKDQKDSSQERPLSPQNNDLIDETTVIVLEENPGQGKVLRKAKSTHNLNIEENASRKKQPSSNPERKYEGLSPRGILHQGANPLHEGLSLYLNENGQPLQHQPISPRQQISPRQPISPGRAHIREQKLTITTSSSSNSEDSEESFEKNREDQESQGNSALYILEQEQPLSIVKYEENRGNALFIRIMDNRFYQPDPRAVVGLGCLGSMIFAVLPPTAMTGVNVNVTGYYFNIPASGWLSTTLVTTFMTTFTLALLTEGYEWGQTIGWPIWSAMKACYSWYTETKEHEDSLSTPLFHGAEYTWKVGYKKTLLYYGINGFSLIAALPEGILPTALLSLVWAKNYSDLVIPAGACVLMRYTGQAYNKNTRILRYLLKNYLNQEPEGKFIYMGNGLENEEVENNFYKYNLDPERATEHKSLVRGAIHRSLRDIEENDDTAAKKYEIVNAERDIIKGLSINEKQYFALSALMNRPTPDKPTSIANIQKTGFYPLTVNCLKIQCQKGISLIQKPVEFLKIPLKTLALVGAGMAIEQGLTIVMRYWLPNSPRLPQLINVSSGTLIAFYTANELLHLAKAVKEYNTPKASLATVPNFSLASFGAVIPAGFSALVGVILGFQYVDESESSQKWKALTAAYALDTFLSSHSHFKNKLQDFLTAAVTTIPEYTKECVVEYTPQFIKEGTVYIKEGIVNKTPKCLKEFMSSSYQSLSDYISLPYQRSWLWKWHHDLDETVNDGNDSVTNASLYFTTQGNQPKDTYYDESSAYGENVDYHYNYDSD